MFSDDPGVLIYDADRPAGSVAQSSEPDRRLARPAVRRNHLEQGRACRHPENGSSSIATEFAGLGDVVDAVAQVFVGQVAEIGQTPQCRDRDNPAGS